jgi:energy-converting hydrogenase B subunit D
VNTAPAAVDFLVAAALALVVAVATVAALTRDPVRQSVVLSVLGLTLALLFLTVQAPDVALSQLAVGSAVTPLLILLTVRKVRRGPRGGSEPPHDSAADTASDGGEGGTGSGGSAGDAGGTGSGG